MKNILVNYTGRKGGGSMYAYEMTKGFIENGVNVYAIISKQCENLDDWKKLKLKRLIIINTYTNKVEFFYRTILFFLFRFKIKNSFKNIRIDLIYCPMITYWMSLINNLFNDSKIFITIHDPIAHSGESIFLKLLNKLLVKEIKKSDCIIILSSLFKNYICNKYSKSESNVIVVPHGIFHSYVEKSLVNDNPIIKYEENKTNFLFFGRIEEYKGIDILLHAYFELEKKYLNKITLTIVGSGDFTPYNRLFDKLSNKVLINRWIKDEEVNKFWRGKNIVTVLPYKDASQSGVINVAMLNKSLIIASDVGGLSEQLDYGRLGILVKANDIKELYNAMSKIANNGFNYYSSYCDEAYKFTENLSWKKLAETILTKIE